jgi:hypothetical protein
MFEATSSFTDQTLSLIRETFFDDQPLTEENSEDTLFDEPEVSQRDRCE